MSDDAPPDPDHKLLDFEQFVKRRKAAECDHGHVTVDEVLPQLTCDDCGADLDPWWYIRALAAQEDEQRAHRAAQRERYTKWAAQVRAQVEHYRTQIEDLVATKNRLANEWVDGQRVGSQVRRRRTSRLASGKKSPAGS